MGFCSRRVVSVITSSLLLASTLAAAADHPNLEVRWSKTGNTSDYLVDAEGSPFGMAGASIEVSSTTAPPNQFGGAISGVDASQFRGQVIQMSADLSVTDAPGGAAIWMRADGGTGPLEFRTSAMEPLIGTISDQERKIEMLVPPNADAILFGMVLSGSGEARGEDLKMVVRDAEGVADAVTPLQMIEASLEIVKANALNAQRVDFHAAKREMKEMVAGLDSASSAYPAVRTLLARLGDNHSFLIQAQDIKQYTAPTSNGAPPQSRLINGTIGYLSIPGFIGTDETLVRRYVEDLRGSISELSAAAPIAWIIDLRDNSGGNMWPMLDGLKPFLGKTNIGGFKNRRGELRPWELSDNQFAGSPSPDLTAARVAVLYSNKTNSAGEAVAIAFIGRDNTRSFGQATAGRSTANAGYRLPDGSRIELTTAKGVDRKGAIYGGVIEPDVTIEDAQAGTGEDPVLEAAISWLEASPAR